MMACLQATLVVFMILCGIVWSEQRYTKCTDPLGMEDGRIENGAITSSSQASDDKGPENARLNSVHDAWTSGITDYNQYIQVDLRRRHEITGIGTQGRGGSDDYITEYHVLYSDNGRDWMDYVNKLGRTKTFNANTDSTSMVQNTFEQPIVARYIRINPVQWHQYISMRMELFGCIYSSQTVQFGGDSLVRYDVSEHAYAIHSQHDSITLRFRTNEQDGIMMYGQGSQGDYICMQLVKGKLYLTLNLGTTWDSPGET
ncbi:PREDICTED: neurexin-4-like, partial [Priapulus caudatus]|uniref:Neurexin-4-like n=1 Tax=Priapulus caudatus TaxID=37621 RepID=A0ABM1EE12_PRICU